MSDMEKELNQLEKQRIEEIKKMYDEYEIKIRKEFDKQNSGSFLFHQDNDDVRTIKLSNSTTPLACY